MSEMVDKVAEAIRQAHFDAPEGSLFSEYLQHMARAAIEAMKQPTQTMEYAGGIKCEEMMFGGDEDYTGVIFKDMGTVWRTMVDAALTETSSPSPGTTE